MTDISNNIDLSNNNNLNNSILENSILENTINEITINENTVKNHNNLMSPLTSPMRTPQKLTFNQQEILEKFSNISNEDELSDLKEFVIFKHQWNTLQKNNNHIIKDCKSDKRLLDLKYDTLTNWINNIQTSVIFFSTISGFLQATRIQFSIPDTIIAIISISISTYITLLLSISKYYKLDELKERIQNLREKYVTLHNRLEYRIDTLTPWFDRNLWIYHNPQEKLKEWTIIYNEMQTDYEDLIKTKKDLVSEFEIIMDTISRNKYMIVNIKQDNQTRTKFYKLQKESNKLEQKFKKRNLPARQKSIIKLQHDVDSIDPTENIV